MPAAVLLFYGLLGLFLLNWLVVSGVTVALGLRRRRWGTPGGGAAVAAGVLMLVVPLGIAGLYGVGLAVQPDDDWAAAAFVAFVGLLLGAGVASHLALAAAVIAAWRAADAVDRPALPPPAPGGTP